MVDHPGRERVLCRAVGNRMAVRTLRRQRHEQRGPSLVDLDRHRVEPDQPPEPIGDLPQHGTRIEGGEDRFGDSQELTLAPQLALEPR